MHVKTSIKAALAILAACAMYSIAAAVPINGVINFTGGAVLNNPVGSATEVTSWSNVVVQSDSGDFATYLLPNTSVGIQNNWMFNSGPISNFWSALGFSFDLTSSSITYQGPTGLIVDGYGTASGYGFDATPGTWSFSTQGSPAGTQFSFSSSTTVPDGGTTALLLGLGILGVGFVSRRLKSQRA